MMNTAFFKNSIKSVLIAQFFLQPLAWSHAQTFEQKLSLLQASPEASAQLNQVTESFGDRINQHSLDQKIRILQKFERKTEHIAKRLQRISADGLAKRTARAQKLLARFHIHQKDVVAEETFADDVQFNDLDQEFGNLPAIAESSVQRSSTPVAQMPAITSEESKAFFINQVSKTRAELTVEIARLEKIAVSRKNSHSDRMPASDVTVGSVLVALLMVFIIIGIFFLPALIIGTVAAYVITGILIVVEEVTLAIVGDAGVGFLGLIFFLAASQARG